MMPSIKSSYLLQYILEYSNAAHKLADRVKSTILSATVVPFLFSKVLKLSTQKTHRAPTCIRI